MNRLDFQQLADERLRDAQALLETGRFSGAYYLAGYSVECALKACICKLTEFPSRRDARQHYAHDLTNICEQGGLSGDLDHRMEHDSDFLVNWVWVKDWREDSRYQVYARGEAEELIMSIADPEHGVLEWLKDHR